MTARDDSDTWGRYLAWLAWLAPIGALAWGLHLSAGIPEPLEWTYLAAESVPPVDWGELLQLQDRPWYLLAGLWHLFVCKIPWLGYAEAALLVWLVAMVIWRLGLGLLREFATGSLHWGWQCLWAAWVFHPGWGANWLAAERARHLLPLLGLLLALRLLYGTGSFALRWLAALVVVWGTQATGGAGLVSFFAAPLLVYAAALRAEVPRPARSAWCFAGWAALGGLLIWHGLRLPATFPGLLAALGEDPGAALAWLAEFLVEPQRRGMVLLLAALALLVLPVAVLRRRREPLSWLALGLLVFGCAGLVELWDRSYRPEDRDSILDAARLWEMSAWFPPLGAGLLLLCRQQLAGLWRSAAPLLLGALLVLSLQSWVAGSRHLRLRAAELQRAAALLVLDEMSGGQVLGIPDIRSGLDHLVLPLERLAELREQGRLDRLPKFEGLELGPEIPRVAGTAGQLIRIEGRALEAELVGTPLHPAPALVLMMVERPGRAEICGFLRPDLRGSLRWVRAEGSVLNPEGLRDGARLVGYGLDLRPFRLRPLQGLCRWSGGAWHLEGQR